MREFKGRRVAATLIAGVAIVASVGIVALPANALAASGLSVNDPQSLLQAAAPAILAGDSPTTSVNVGNRSNLQSESAKAVATSVPVAVTVAPKDSTPQTVALSLDGATSPQFTNVQGISSFNTDSADVKRYAVANPVGVSIVTAYQHPQATYVSTTTFTLPDGFYTKKTGPGNYYLTNGDEIRGVVMAPWAHDATGRPLPTTFSWNGLSVTQRVKVPSDAVFPIVADPAWSYTWTATINIGSPLNLRTQMHNCFNCVFPIQGAPHAFPTPGTDLPLYVGIAGVSANFHCTFGNEAMTPPVPQLYPNGEFGFYFNSASGHVDGLGSMISFDFWTKNESNSAIKMRFTVYGSVANSNPGGVPQWLYLVGAKAAWGGFVQKVVMAEGGPINPQAQAGYWSWIN